MAENLNDMDFNIAIKKFIDEMHIDEATYKQILQSVVDSTVPDLPKIEQAINTADFEVIQQLAHRIKGTLLNMRLDQMAAPMIQIDSLSKKKEGLDQIKVLYPEFKQMFSKLCDFIRK